MRKAAVVRNTSSMGLMLTIAIAMANGSASVAQCEKKRVRGACDIQVIKEADKSSNK